MNEQQAQAVCQALKRTAQKALEEQDRWRERIDAMKGIGSMDVTDRLVELGWKGIRRLMEGEYSPATHQDREKIRGLSWEDEPFRVRLSQIEDERVRVNLYFLNEIIEQHQRIRSIARFLEVVGAHPESRGANRAFAWWKRHSVYEQLAHEAADDGDETQAESRSKCAEVAADVYDILVGIPRQSLTASSPPA